MKYCKYFLTCVLLALPQISGAEGVALTPGALVAVTVQSTVGILLDAYPKSVKQKVTVQLLNKPESYWKARAFEQIETAQYKLLYRNFYYADKGRLPLPPKELWRVQVNKPHILKVDSHAAVGVTYKFSSLLLTDDKSVGLAEPQLGAIGGIWDEPFVFPLDPQFLLERTGFACMDESEFPPNSVDSENARNFFDSNCEAGINDCHTSKPEPTDSCVLSLKKNVGRMPVNLHFERLAWDPKLANQVRIGKVNPQGADLEVLSDALKNSRLIYRYVPKDSCAIAEKCVSGSGWRRLLQFDASVANRGLTAIHLGDVSPNSELVKQNMFEHSSCHDHYHFSHYGKFSFGQGAQEIGSKRAFCLESTSRYSNNESTPLTHPYSCHYQGIEAGWGDDYIAGIECQWVDVTSLKGPVTDELTFQSNPDQFLCEGKPILDRNNNFTFVPTPFKSETGTVQNRIDCQFGLNWNQNNTQKLLVTIPSEGSYVTSACRHDEDSWYRNCGFKAISNLKNCTPDLAVRLFCKTPQDSAPVVLRFCEGSRVLGTGTACTHRDSLAYSVIEGPGKWIEFKCPAERDPSEPGGAYSLYSASAHEGDLLPAVTCTAH